MSDNYSTRGWRLTICVIILLQAFHHHSPPPWLSSFNIFRGIIWCVPLKCGLRQREAHNKNERWWNPVGHTMWGISINILPHTGMCYDFSQQDDCTSGKHTLQAAVSCMCCQLLHATQVIYLPLSLLFFHLLRFLFRKFRAKMGYITFKPVFFHAHMNTYISMVHDIISESKSSL